MLEYVEKYKNRVALENEIESITYNTLINRVKALITPLQEIAGHNKEIAIIMQAGIEYIVYCLACIEAGLNVHVLHPKSARLTLNKILEWGIPILCDSENESTIKQQDINSNCIAIVCDTIIPTELQDFTGLSDLSRVTFTTSGTTSHGTKFVSLPVSAIMAKSDMIANIMEINESDINLLLSPLCFIQSFWTVIIHLIRGAKIFVAKFTLQSMEMLLEKNYITTLITTPSILRSILKNGIPSHYLRLLGIGGDYIDKTTLHKLKKSWCDVSYCNIYGCTETAAADVIFKPHVLRDINSKLDSIGVTSKFSTVKVINEDGIESKPYEEGQIIIKSPFTQTYYYRSNIRMNNNERYFETKDIGYRDEEGFIYYCGRMAGKIICNGQNISTYEIENLLYQLEMVKEVVVVGEPHEIYGEIPICYIVPNRSFSGVYEKVIDYLYGSLEKYKIPRKITIVDSLPKTNSDKIIRLIDRYYELNGKKNNKSY